MIPQVPPPEPASDFGIERTAPMNTTPFPGHGMRETAEAGQPWRDTVSIAASFVAPRGTDADLMSEALAADDAFADAVQGALSEPDNLGPPPTGTAKDRVIFERSIVARRQEKARQQAIVAAANAKIRALTLSIRSMEDALDGLLISEA